MTKWYVTVNENSDHADDPDVRVWTVSRDPDDTGWETDGGFPGYGLTKHDAEELANAANRIKMTEWRPIETAPKDGTYFVAYWPPLVDEPHVQQYYVCHYAFNSIWPSWIDLNDMPTHWHPLPVLPEDMR